MNFLSPWSCKIVEVKSPVPVGPTAEVLEGLGALAGHQRAPGGPEAEAPEQAGLEVLRSQQAEVGVDLSRDLGKKCFPKLLMQTKLH